MALINRHLLPIKAHYFFFMAAMGPILPQINVFGKQLGISPDVMGLITSVLPILYILAKPAIGYLIDYFPSLRKIIFMTIVLVMIISYATFYFVPTAPVHKINQKEFHTFVNSTLMGNESSKCTNYHRVDCFLDCSNQSALRFEGRLLLASNENLSSDSELYLCSTDNLNTFNAESFIACDVIKCTNDDNFYYSTTFWSFTLLMCIGTIAFNVGNCVSDATCFDMLGEKPMNYGAQRVWGTIGFGVTALLSGIVVHNYQIDVTNSVKTIGPALIIMVIFGVFDVISIKWLKLPKFNNEGESIMKKMRILLKQKPIVIFLVFATLAGILDSFIIYYMFWFLEEVAEQTGHMNSIKLIEGYVVAAECLGSEILFFLISGKILKRIGYVHCLSLCFFMYFIRLGLISMITNPWYFIPIEFCMQGCTYALCYTCIVAYASAISPPGTTATVQGFVAGMDDGVGFAIGSLISGQLYKRFGGAMSFRIFAIGALITCIAHILLRPADQDKKYIDSQLKVGATEYDLVPQKIAKNDINIIET